MDLCLLSLLCTRKASKAHPVYYPGIAMSGVFVVLLAYKPRFRKKKGRCHVHLPDNKETSVKASRGRSRMVNSPGVVGEKHQHCQH